MAFGWEGEKVRLVPLEKGRHFDNCVRWLNDPIVTRWTLIGEEKFFNTIADPGPHPTDIVFAIETRDDEEQHIGVTGLHDVNYRHGTAVTGAIIGRPQLHNRGYGTDAARIRTRYAFDILGLRLLLSETLAGNGASAHVLENVGYQQYGVIPGRYWKHGDYHDAIMFYLRREDWRAANPPS